MSKFAWLFPTGVFLLALWGFHSGVFSSEPRDRGPASVDTSTQCRSLPHEGFSVDGFLEEIQRRQLKTVEEVICLVPEKHRKNHVLVHSSSSAQSSRPSHPRAIMFSAPERGGKHVMDFAISFNGHPEDSNFNNVEVMKSRRNPKSGQPHFEFVDVNCENRPCHVSGANPPECLQCHQVDSSSPRPIWDAKGFFPQAYGRAALGGTISQEPDGGKNFSNFQKIAARDSRYSLLPGVEKHKLVNGTIPSLIKANSVFAEGLASVNTHRVVEMIQETEDYHAYKYAILASLLICEPMTDFVPKPLWSQHERLDSVELEFRDPKNYVDIVNGRRRVNAEVENRETPPALGASSESEARQAVQGILDMNHNPPLPIQPFVHDLESKAGQWGQPVPSLAGTRWLFEGRGISIVEWALDVPQAGRFSGYRMLNSRGSDQGVQGQFFDTLGIGFALAKRDPQLAMVFNQGRPPGVHAFERRFPIKKSSLKQHQIYCESLKTLSLRSLKRLARSQGQSSAKQMGSGSVQ